MHGTHAHTPGTSSDAGCTHTHGRVQQQDTHCASATQHVMHLPHGEETKAGKPTHMFSFVYFQYNKKGHPVLGLVSGLEAFSREPPCDSVGALALRQTPETRGTAWEFLSYYPILPSRRLRDPFTISHTISSHTQTHVYREAHTEPPRAACT
ncbi:unnamed protein product [Trypanosoma congolense IL3000]|uniref:WGS project CAEQ00000000 data, annotated contig 216 n=1 Tax=Trypanosoma congolense (strain IL3000) TaxID=1068625 RepID=F9WBY4_TRYCI|nr:unnamed protein product [Trypanosoma congolense IL3000]